MSGNLLKFLHGQKSIKMFGGRLGGSPKVKKMLIGWAGHNFHGKNKGLNRENSPKIFLLHEKEEGLLGGFLWCKSSNTHWIQ